MWHKDPESAFLLCIAQLNSGNPEAQNTLQTILKNFPRHSEGWGDIGKALFKAGQFEGATTAFGRAAKFSDNSVFRFGEASSLMSLMRHRDAITALEAGIILDANNTHALLSLAKCWRAIGQPRKALEQLQKAEKLEPGNWNIWFALGLINEDLHNTNAAIEAYRRCVGLKLDFHEAHINLGLALQHSGQLEQGLLSYKAALSLRPGSFGRIAQSLSSASQGQMWLNLGKLRQSLTR